VLKYREEEEEKKQIRDENHPVYFPSISIHSISHLHFSFLPRTPKRPKRSMREKKRG